MSVVVDGESVRLEGRCRLEEAEPLLDALLRLSVRQIDMTGCTFLHSAVFQILLAARLPVAGEPESGFLATHVLPLLRGRAVASVAGSGSL